MIYIVTGSHSDNGRPFTTIELVTKDAWEAHEMAHELREEEKSSIELADEDYEPSHYTVHEQEC